jgi:L-aminopeptidase/D-esterase-like protein
VNARGAVVDRSGNVVRGCIDPSTGERTHPTALAMAQIRERQAATSDPPAGGDVTTNTTLTVLVTNVRLDNRQLRQLGRQVHTSMARGIQPFQTLTDGDVLFAVSTNEVESTDAADGLWLGTYASELAWDAILASYADA